MGSSSSVFLSLIWHGVLSDYLSAVSCCFLVTVVYCFAYLHYSIIYSIAAVAAWIGVVSRFHAKHAQLGLGQNSERPQTNDKNTAVTADSNSNVPSW